MKRILLLLFAFILSLTLISCDGSKSDEGGKKDENTKNQTEEIKEEKKEEVKTLLDFNFTDVGNNPNNFWQSNYAPAFDDEYIYYIYHKNIYRVSYSGGSPELIVDEAKGFLNVYNGALYYTLSGSNSNPYAKLMKYDLKTGETSSVYELTGTKWKNDYSFNSVLITSGFAFHSICDTSGKGTTWIMATDLNNTNSTYTLHFVGSPRNAQLTTDCEGNVYAIIKTDGSNANRRQVLKVNIEDMKTSYRMMSTVVGEKELPPYATFIWAKNGYTACNNQYLNYYFNEIDTAEIKWYPGEDNYPQIEDDTLSQKLLTTRGQRFIIGDSLLVLGTDIVYTSSDVLGDLETGYPLFIFKNMDLTNPEEIARIQNISFINNSSDNVFGIHNDKLYIVETTDEGKNLITVTPDGEVTRNVIAEKSQTIIG